MWRVSYCYSRFRRTAKARRIGREGQEIEEEKRKNEALIPSRSVSDNVRQIG